MNELTTLNTTDFDGQLLVIVEQSNIEPTKGQQMMQLFVPYFKRMDEVERKIGVLPTENPSKEDVAMAKAIRKALRDNRLEAERIKKQGKETVIIEGRLYDNLYNIIDNSSKPLEKRCEAIEKWHEIQEAARLEAVYQTRKTLCDEIGADTVFTNIRAMSDEQFDAYVTQVQAANAARIEAERLEAERIAAEERKLDERMKTRLKHLASNDIDGSLLQVREISDEQFYAFCARQIETRRQAEEAKQQAIEAAKKAEAERVELERIHREKQEQAAKERAELEARMKQERDKAAKVAEAARAEAEKARAELAKAEQEKREEAARLEAAALAPDKEKLAFLVTQIAGINIPELATPQAARITAGVKTLLGKVRAYIEQEADKL